MTPVSNGPAGLIAAIAKPTENWAARSAARQEAVQLQQILTQQAQQEVLENQQAAAALEQQLAAERALPFFGKDLLNLSAHVRDEEKQLFERLRDNYAGDTRRWYAAEGQSWMAGAAARLQKAPFYQQATQNRAAVLAAKSAIDKGERVVGTTAADGYRTGEQQLQDFLSGKADTFNYNGSYKPEDDFAEIRKNVYAPNAMPWQRVAMSEEEKLNYLIDAHGKEGGLDRYLRQHKGTSVFYKNDPLTKAYEFQRDQGRYAMDQGRFGMEQQRLNMAVQDQAMQRQLFGLQKEGLQLSNLKKRAELSGGSGPSGIPYDHYLLSSPSEVIPLRHDPANPKQLSNGVDLGKINRLAGVTLYGQGDDILARHLGLQRTKDGYRGQFDSAFTTENGVNAINLKGVKYDILGIDSKAFYDPSALSPNASRQTPLQGYARVTLKFSPYAAEQAGLYNPNRLPFVDKQKPTSLFDTETRTGAGVYDPATQTATLYVPAGDLRNANFLKAMQREEKGTRSANEDFNAPFVPRPTW